MKPTEARPGITVITDEGNRGRIENVSDDVHTNIHGKEYRWALVNTGHQHPACPNGRKAVWPTNRLHAAA